MSRRGVVVSLPEQRLLGYLALARYFTAEQAQSILAEHRERRVFCRRLRRLADPSAGTPLMRSLRLDKGGHEAWALTGAGWQIAEKEVPYLRPPPAKDIQPETFRHHQLLTDVFVDLVLALRQKPDDPVSALPFQWIVEGDEHFQFTVYDRRTGLMARAVVKPDALLEAPGVSRRYFIEAETGARRAGITTGNITNTAALMRKLQRYGTYFTGFVEGTSGDTWYTRRFSKELFPEVAVLVHSRGRKDRVEIAVKKWIGHAGGAAPFSVRILTFEEAPGALAAMIAGAKAPPSRMLAVPEKVAYQLRDGFNTLARAYNELRALVDAHNRSAGVSKILVPPAPRQAVLELAALLRHDLLGEPRDHVKWATRLIDDGKRLGS
jgi:hypothetical protein